MLFVLAFTSADIIFHTFLKLHSALSEKKILIPNFPFLTDTLNLPTPLKAKIHQARQKFFVDAPLETLFKVVFGVTQPQHGIIGVHRPPLNLGPP